MADKIVGRTAEADVLRLIYNSPKAEFVALYGRRRVGKTFLIRNFFEDESCIFFYCSGIKDGQLSLQLHEFAKHIGNIFYNGVEIATRENWLDAFEDLYKAISGVAKNKKIVLFFDELPWMATPRSKLLQAIDYYWNRYFSHDSRVKLIVCGSSASWIIKKIINSKGGLYNRVTRTIKLEPFTLHEVRLYIRHLKIKLNDTQILELYMVFGGIPHYLALLKKGFSAAQCIEDLCFQKNGALVGEFDKLYASLFSDDKPYLCLVRTIAKHRNGIGRAEIIKESGLPEGGTTSRRLKELEEAGFITEFMPYGHREKGNYYKVTDEFTLFYLCWIEPNKKTILRQKQANGYWISKSQSASWKIWSGLAYEAVCNKHLPQVRSALQIESGANVGSWRYAPRKSDKTGAQIDLLFDRTDGVVTICEIKYRQKPFAVDKEYATKLLNKIEVFKQQTRTEKQIFIAMITAAGLKPTMYSEDLVMGVVSLADLFKE